MALKLSLEEIIDFQSSTSYKIDDLFRNIPEKFFDGAHSLLDIGCGDGRITRAIAEQFPRSQIVGCDISSSMIEFAKQQYKYPNLSFIREDCRNLDFENKFDRIVSINCLHYIKNHAKLLQQIYNGLTSNGKVFIIAVPKSPKGDLHKACLNVAVSLKWFFHFLHYKSFNTFYTEEYYRKVVKKIGFSIDWIGTRMEKICFQSRDALDKLLRVDLAALQSFPEKKRKAFFDDLFLELVKKDKVHPNGEIWVNVPQIEMILSKK